MLLRQKTIKKLIDWLVQEPFSPSTSNTCYVPREEKYVNLTILDSMDYEERFSNSDREVLMKQRFEDREGVTMNELFKANDEIVVARGVGGLSLHIFCKNLPSYSPLITSATVSVVTLLLIIHNFEKAA